MIQRFTAWLSEDQINFQLFISGNENAFAHLHKQFYKSTFYFASRLLKDNFEIDCIIQDAFLNAWEGRDSIKDLMHFHARIRLFIKRGCSHYRRGRWRRNVILIEFYRANHASGDDLKTMSDGQIATDPSDELLKLLENAMPYLPATCRNVQDLLLKGLSPKKISQHLGVSCQKINSERRKIIRLLKQIIPRLKKACEASEEIRIVPVANYEVYLSKHQAQIFTLYYINKLPFSAIALELGLTPFELLKEYDAARRILYTVNKIKQ